MANRVEQLRSVERPRRRGLTLIEMMVSMVITLMMIFALAQAFQTVSATISYNRSTIEMAGQLRSTTLLLQRDLEGLTVRTLPLADPASNDGYFEYIERQDKDYLTSDTDTSQGDIDDVLMFTSRSANAPFSGLFDGGVIEAPDAEIVWWAAGDDRDNSGTIDAHERFIYRRVLLVRPELDGTGALLRVPRFANDPNLWPKVFPTSASGLARLRDTLWSFFNNNDISVRLDWRLVSGGVRVNLTANSLSDLAKRENRFAHVPIMFDNLPMRLVTASDFPTFPSYPFPADVTFPLGATGSDSITYLDRLRHFGRRAGEDIVLQNALAFDVRAFDLFAQVRAHPGDDGQWGVASQDDDKDGTPDNPSEAGWTDSDDETVTPGDPGFASAAVIGTGGYVDLNYNSVFGYPVNSSFSGGPHVRSGLSGLRQVSWDTWSLHYESDGVNQDGDGFTDEGSNGFDDDGLNGVDDPGERETSPAYNVPLRGIQVRFRIMETDNRLVRQSSVVINFMPE